MVFEFTPGFLCKGCRKVRHMDISKGAKCSCGAFICPVTREQLSHNTIIKAVGKAKKVGVRGISLVVVQ